MIQCDAIGFLLGALALFVLPMKWVLSAAAAALFHEVCHMIILRLLGGRILSVRVSFYGCRIMTGPMEDWKQICSILAGPTGSLALLLLRRKLPLIALCGLIQGLFNMLPMLPLDGGRLLRLFLYRLQPDCAERILIWTGTLCRIGFVILFFLLFLDIG